MSIISISFRFLEKQISCIFNFLRIIRLKLLYTGLEINLQSTVERNCKITYIKGGRSSIKNYSNRSKYFNSC